MRVPATVVGMPGGAPQFVLPPRKKKDEEKKRKLEKAKKKEEKKKKKRKVEWSSVRRDGQRARSKGSTLSLSGEMNTSGMTPSTTRRRLAPQESGGAGGNCTF